MTEPVPVLIPLLNPNEPEARLAALNVSEGQFVAAGAVLCTLETTKSTAEVVAQVGGHVAGLRFTKGELLRAGERLCYLAPDAEWKPPSDAAQTGSTSAAAPQQTGTVSAVPGGLRISQPALALAQQSGLELRSLPIGPLVTESQVRSMLEKLRPPDSGVAASSDFDPTAIVIYGGGGHGKMVIELLRAAGSFRPVGIIDDGISPEIQILDLPVLGGGEILPQLHSQGLRLAVNAVGGIGNIAVRIQVFQKLAQAGFTCPTITHPRACIEPSARLSAAAQVLALAYIGSEAQIGYGTIIGTGAIVSHDCRLGSYVNISPGALLAGGAVLEEGVLVGMGATVNLQVTIGAGAKIGNGATVKADVPANTIVRAGMIWPG